MRNGPPSPPQEVTVRDTVAVAWLVAVAGAILSLVSTTRTVNVNQVASR